jgi:hypothetical protein
VKFFIYWTVRYKAVPDRGLNFSFTGRSGVKRYRTEGESFHLLDRMCKEVPGRR